MKLLEPMTSTTPTSRNESKRVELRFVIEAFVLFSFPSTNIWFASLVNNYHLLSLYLLPFACVLQWKEQGHTDLDLAEFRLMVLVQMCVLIGVGIKKGHVGLHNLVYPVAGLGAAEQLKHIEDPEDRQYVVDHIVKQTGLEQFGTNAAEGCLCETSEKRYRHIFDVFCRGQCLFAICTTTGRNLVKFYGSAEWVPLVYD